MARTSENGNICINGMDELEFHKVCADLHSKRNPTQPRQQDTSNNNISNDLYPVVGKDIFGDILRDFVYRNGTDEYYINQPITLHILHISTVHDAKAWQGILKSFINLGRVLKIPFNIKGQFCWGYVFSKSTFEDMISDLTIVRNKRGLKTELSGITWTYSKASVQETVDRYKKYAGAHFIELDRLSEELNLSPNNTSHILSTYSKRIPILQHDGDKVCLITDNLFNELKDRETLAKYLPEYKNESVTSQVANPNKQKSSVEFTTTVEDKNKSLLDYLEVLKSRAVANSNNFKYICISILDKLLHKYNIGEMFPLTTETLAEMCSPLYAEKVLQQLLEDGYLIHKGSGYVITDLISIQAEEWAISESIGKTEENSKSTKTSFLVRLKEAWNVLING